MTGDPQALLLPRFEDPDEIPPPRNFGCSPP